MAQVLQSLTLHAYRGIAGLKLDGLAPVSLIVGANNSGKSSILEAAGLLLRPPDPSQWVSAVRHRDTDMALVDGLWSMFPGSEALHPEDGLQESKPLHLEGITSGGTRSLSAHCLVSQSLGSSEEAELAARIEVSVDGAPSLTLKFPSTSSVLHQIPTFRVLAVSPGTHLSTRSMVEHLSRVVEEGKKKLAIELLQIFDPRVEGLDISASFGRESVLVTHRTRGVVDLASFGDGARRTVTLALALTRASQGVLLVDEIETGIHHHVLQPVLTQLIAAAIASQVQIVTSTHSLEALDALIMAADESDGMESLAAFHVRRKETGVHEVLRYAGEKLLRLREGGLDIR